MPGAAEADIGQAPGRLWTVQAFVNTLDVEQSTDELASPASLAGWLSAAGLLDQSAPAQDGDLRLALDLRESLRGVLRSHATHGPAQGQPGGLGAIAADLPVRLEVTADGRIEPAPAGSGAQAALTRILLIAAEAATLGTWSRLKACSADDCQWAFYDRSPTRNGCWCSMQICGARAKSRAYRERRASNRRRLTTSTEALGPHRPQGLRADEKRPG
jgi:predicted RNA-binding Zn ribbon-like protein